jgi:nicotinamidase-related amidase
LESWTPAGRPACRSSSPRRSTVETWWTSVGSWTATRASIVWRATELVQELSPREGDYFIAKRRYSCFFGTDLEILLRGLNVQTLLLVGGLTDVCVHYTFADAHQWNYHLRVLEDCVLGSTVERHNASLSAMEYLQHGARRISE